MNISRWIALILLAAGCGSESKPGQIGFAPITDAAIATSDDVGQDPDLTQDSGVVVPQDMGNIPDMPDATADLSVEDANSDAATSDAADVAIDMAEQCWGERTGLPNGTPCGDTPATGECNVVTQTGCADQKYCTFVFNGTGLGVACTPIRPQCGFLKIDQVCVERVGQTAVNLGFCEPGSYCPVMALSETQASCARYCELKTGLGCEAEEVCVQVVNGQSAQSLAGYGECSTSKVCSL